MGNIIKRQSIEQRLLKIENRLHQLEREIKYQNQEDRYHSTLTKEKMKERRKVQFQLPIVLEERALIEEYSSPTEDYLENLYNHHPKDLQTLPEDPLELPRKKGNLGVPMRTTSRESWRLMKDLDRLFPFSRQSFRRSQSQSAESKPL